MTVDRLIDNFAADLAAAGAYIERHDHEKNIVALDARLPDLLPPPFRSLVMRYSFLAFEIGTLQVFGNTGEEDHEEWSYSLFADKILSPALLTHGYIQFARLKTGSYDPICFDTKRKRGDGESPIVWIDHEGILCYDQIVVRGELAPSFVQ